MKIYIYPNCSTCRIAKKFVEEHKINAELIDITKNQPTKEEIKAILTSFNIPIKKLFNTSGLKYKELNIKDKLIKATEDEAIEILISDGMLMKRPFAFNISQEILLLGFKEDVWKCKLA